MYEQFCIIYACAARIGRTPCRRIRSTIDSSSGIFGKIQHAYIHILQHQRTFFINNQFWSRREDSMLPDRTFAVIEHHGHIRAYWQYIVCRVHVNSIRNLNYQVSDRCTTIDGPITIVGFLIVVFHYPCILAGIHIIHDEHRVGSTHQWYSILTNCSHEWHIYVGRS